MDLFSIHLEPFKFNHRPIRLFEAFAGIGTQAMALKRLGIKIEHVGISEIDKYAIKSYNAIHGNVKNYGDICNINGDDLKDIDLFTYSFPCTDLSKVGKQKGLNDTRSGLVYEVIRILKEMTIKPTVLLMENVSDLLSPKFKDGWHEIYNEIESLGYTNYVEILNAKDYGVAQNRNRVFMVSILGEYSYTFPKGFKLEKRLKDYLEQNIDEKYYLSEKIIMSMLTNSSKNYDRRKKFVEGITFGDNIARTITTNVLRSESNYIAHTFMDHHGMLDAVMIKTDNVENLVYKTREDDMPRHRIHDTKSIGFTITTNESQQPSLIDNLRIRKLTPREAFRLMDVSESDIDIILNEVCNTQAYKQAGNAIVVNVLVEIFKNIF